MTGSNKAIASRWGAGVSLFALFRLLGVLAWAMSACACASGPRMAKNAGDTVACNPGDASFICGLKNPEDLVRLGGTPWVIVSQLNFSYPEGVMLYDQPGPLEAVNINTHEVSRLSSAPEAAVDWDRASYPDCSAPPAILNSHGLSVRSLGRGEFRLYAVNHYERESVEIFDLRVGDDAVTPTWRGCVMLPDNYMGNAVAVLPDGGIVVSTDKAGAAFWRPGGGWDWGETREGLSDSDNGVEVSDDGEWLYIVHYAAHSVLRVPITGGSPDIIYQGAFSPDNIHKGDDGFLYVSGFFDSPAGRIRECVRSRAKICPTPIAILQIDPDALTVKYAFRSDDMGGAFGAATTALKIDDDFWVGTWIGDRIAIVKKGSTHGGIMGGGAVVKDADKM